MLFTIFTPTFNRANTLPRLYQSLVNQSIKDFIWLVVDDGSKDSTKDLVSNWIKEKKIEIGYHFKENGGKHTAMKLAFELTDTKYLIEIDSDDELTTDAVENFKNEWTAIENKSLDDQFADVSALSYSPDGKLIGNFYFPAGTDYIDSYWHEMVLKYKNNNEHIICWNVEKLKECVKIPDKFWLADKVNYLDEKIFWARIGRKYKTRYINKCLRFYHSDAGESLLRIKDKTKGHYNNLASQTIFLDENLDYFFWNPKYFFNIVLKYIVSDIELKISPYYISKEMRTCKLRIAYFLFLPVGLFAFIYFKIIKPKYWF